MLMYDIWIIFPSKDFEGISIYVKCNSENTRFGIIKE